MAETYMSENTNNDDQVDVLEEFAPRIRDILRGYRDKRQLASIAKQLGFHQSRLTEMITKNEKGDYKTRITPYYIARFIEGNLMTVDQILHGRKLDDLPTRTRMFFERMMVSRSTLRLVIQAQRRGINLDRILKEILFPKNQIQ